MFATAVTKRYAEALFAAAHDARLVAEVEHDLAAMAQALADPARAALLRNPTAEIRSQKEQIIGPLEAKLRTNLVKNTIMLLLDRRRAEVLFGLPDAYHRLTLESRGEAEGVVESARPLTEAEHRAVEEKLSAATSRKVRLTARVDPELLGGLRATVGSLRFDSTVRTRLTELREKLLSARLTP